MTSSSCSVSIDVESARIAVPLAETRNIKKEFHSMSISQKQLLPQTAAALPAEMTAGASTGRQIWAYLSRIGGDSDG